VMVENHLSSESSISEQEMTEKIESKLSQVQETVDAAEDQLTNTSTSTVEIIPGQTTETGAASAAGTTTGAGTGEGNILVSTVATSSTLDIVKEKLGQAKTLLEGKDYAGAMSAMKDVKTLAMEVEETTAGIAAGQGALTTGSVNQAQNSSSSSQGIMTPTSSASGTTSTTLINSTGDKLISGQSATSTKEVISQ
jgi:hypothetical protein